MSKVKLADKTYIDYEEYVEKKEAEKESQGKELETDNGTIESDLDLPF